MQELAASITALQRTADLNAAAAAEQLTQALGRASQLEGTVATLRQAAEAAAGEREEAAQHARTLAAEVVASRQQAAAQVHTKSSCLSFAPLSQLLLRLR